MRNFLLAAALALPLSTPAFAEGTHDGEHAASSEMSAQAEVEYTTGTIKKIDSKAGKVTIMHGPIANLDMPAMTMVFRADEATMDKLSEGADIEFVVERVNGKLTITQMK